MAITSYPRTIVKGTSSSTDQNSGVGLMLWDSTTQTYIAATPSTFSGGGGGGGNSQIFDSNGSPIYCDDATNGILKVAIHNSGGGNVAVSTSSLQTTLNNLITTLNSIVATASNQTAQTTAINAQTNGGVIVDRLGTQTLTASYVALASATCKYVTLINLSTNVKFTYNIGNSGSNLTLEAGYSVKINCSNANTIYIAQTTGEGNTAQYIVSA